MIHGDKYDYSKVNYINNETKVILIYDKKEYLYSPTLHLLGGHPKGALKGSKGEECIKFILDKYNIEYRSEFMFDDCRYINRLPFDFYLPKYNLLIEYDGEHHFLKIKHYPENHYENTLRNDCIKNEYSIKNKIQLLRIPYTDYNNIEEIIINFLKNNNINCQENHLLTK